MEIKLTVIILQFLIEYLINILTRKVKFTQYLQKPVHLHISILVKELKNVSFSLIPHYEKIKPQLTLLAFATNPKILQPGKILFLSQNHPFYAFLQ